jgi:hypothetical protein
MAEDGDDRLRSAAVPQRGCPDFPAARGHHLAMSGQDPLRLVAHQPIGADLDGDRPLGVLAQREARNAGDRGLLLDSTRVGQHDARVGHQLEEIEVAERIDEVQTRLRGDAHRQPELRELLARARVHREVSG